MVSNNRTLGQYFKELGSSILGTSSDGYSIVNSSGELLFKKYITNITLEITTYAEGIYFQTEEDRQEIRNELLKNVQNELINF
jgi:hypothetical protein